MKFPRTVRFARPHLDPAPYASVFFCLLIFVLLGSLVYTPGVRIQLPASAAALPGVNGPTLAVAVGVDGTLFFQNHVVQPSELQQRLKEEVARQTEPLTLVVMADKSVTLEQIDNLRDLATQAGVQQIVQAVQPRMFEAPAAPAAPAAAKAP